MYLKEIATPAAIVDEARMARNLNRMQSRMNALRVAFRPHVKTAKCVEIARRQQALGAHAITVSTLKEAEEFFAAGFRDILYAVAIIPAKLPVVEDLMRRGCDLKILIDSVEAARAVAARGAATSTRFKVLIEVDTDGHRAGVKPEDERLIEIGRALTARGCELAGVMTHAGASYDCSTPEALRAIANQERDLTVLAADRLRTAHLAAPIVSVGSTPTALSAEDLTGVTEVRAGVYVFFDLFMAGVGVCTIDDIALSVLTAVVGHQPDKGWAIVDAGWMAMSRDRGTQKQKRDYGYGQVCGLDGAVLDGYVLSGANQEHGILSREGAPDTDIATRFPIGTRLRILPNHACATGAQFPEYQALTEDGALQPWGRFHGW
jgi:D-serine deaminase-like pyridoxal phosphate-dependent protein